MKGLENLSLLQVLNLQLHSTYFLIYSVLVISEGSNMTGSGSLEVSVHQLGPLAVTSANKLTFGTGSRVVLDAVLSKDQDNTPGDLKVSFFPSFSKNL